MRLALAALYQAGISRARFSARYGGRSQRGYYTLNAIETPLGDLIDHLWIKPEQWLSLPPEKGTDIQVVASVERYWRDDGSEDLGLFGVRVIL